MNDLYEALIECSTPVVAQRAGGLRHARGAAPAHPRRRRRVHRRRAAPARRVRRRRARGGRALPGDPRRDARARLAHADGRAARPRRDARPRDGDRRVQPDARAPAAAAGAGGPLAVLVRRTTPAWPARARRSSAASRARPSRPRSPAGSTTRTSSRWCVATAEVAGLHVPVVGHPPEPEPGHDRGPRDGRAEPAGVRRRARGARSTRSPSPARTAHEEAAPPTEGAHGVLIPRRARRRGRDDLVARRDPADPRGGRRRARARPPLRPRARRRGRARGDRAHPARGRRRGPHARGPRRRRDGRDARPASPRSPTPRPRPRRRSAASRRSRARSRPARAGSRGWRCTAAPTRSRGWRSRG